MQELINAPSSDGSFAPKDSFVRLSGKIVSELPIVAGRITLEWPKSGPKTKTYGDSFQLALSSGRTITVHLDPSQLDAQTRSATWREIEHEDFAREFTKDAPGPHIKIQISSRLLIAGQTVSLIGFVQSLRFSGDSEGHRENASQEIEAVYATLLASGDDAEEKLQQKLKDKQDEIASEQKSKERQESLRAFGEELSRSLENPMVFALENWWALLCGLIALVGLFFGVQATFAASYFKIHYLMHMLLVLNAALFLWYLGVSLLPRYSEDGNKPGHIDQSNANIDVAGSLFPGFFLFGVPIIFFLLGSMMFPDAWTSNIIDGFTWDKKVFDYIVIESLGVAAFALVCILWILFEYSRLKYSRLLLSSPRAKLDGGWGYIEGTAKYKTLTQLTLLVGEREVVIDFRGALWACSTRTNADTIASLSHSRSVMVVGRIDAEGASCRGAESLFVYISEDNNSARAALQRRFRGLLVVVGFSLLSLIVSLIFFALYVPFAS